jgi:predicted Fe-S protein YdhL (DUF1289 family)
MAADTPCIGVCYIRPPGSLCTGCGRTLREIARWSEMTPQERRSVMATLRERMLAVGLIPPEDWT